MPPPTSAHGGQVRRRDLQVELLGELPEMTFLCIVPEKIWRHGNRDDGGPDRKAPEMERLLLKELAAHGIRSERINHA